MQTSKSPHLSIGKINIKVLLTYQFNRENLNQWNLILLYSFL